MTIFAIVASGVAVGMTSVFGLTRNNRNRSVAANLASKEMDVIRSTEFESLPLTPQNRNETVDNIVYAINRTTSWVTKDGTSGGACSPPAGTALAFLKVVVSVTWPNMQGAEPVKTETILAPPIGSYDSDTGHLAVRLRDRAGAPLNGQVVTVVGPGGTFQIPTTNGCAFFLSLTPGNFTVSVNSVNYVNGQGVQNPSQVVAVTQGSITSAEFDYDQKATQTLNLVGLTNYGVPSGLGARVANTSLTLGNLEVASPPTSCVATPTTLTSTADASITQGGYGNTNFGTSSIFGTYSDDTSDTRGLVKFTLPSTPSGCTLGTATMRLYNNATNSGRTINVLQANASWTETGVTWNNQPATTGTAVGATTPSSAGWMTWGVTSIVSAQYSGTNHGFSIRDSNEGNNDEWLGFDPRELSNDPELVLTWINPPTPCTPLSVNATEDARVRESSPTNTHGSESTFKVRTEATNKDERSFVKFSLPSAPSGCVLIGATLKLWADSVDSGRVIHAYRVNASWAEATVTWNTQPAVTGSPSASNSLSANGWQSWDVFSLVQAQYSGTNHGFMLRDSAEENSGSREQRYRSSENGTSSNWPLLELTFSAVVTLPTVQTVTASPLFPYPNGYQAWGGTCLDADPQGVNPSGGQPYYPGAQRETAIASNPNQTTVADVTLKSVDVLVKLSNDSPVAGVNVEAYHDPDSGCPSGKTLVLGTTAADGYVHVALPYGTWRFEVSGRTPVGSWPVPVLSPLVANPQAVSVTVN